MRELIGVGLLYWIAIIGGGIGLCVIVSQKYPKHSRLVSTLVTLGALGGAAGLILALVALGSF
ncbi:hypothetical protein MnTg02_00076 [bacterium MnTg02]|nr:hypothetical protein MnTg02_00076 [bacterium MnTg02]